jgi:hypothetical protein
LLILCHPGFLQYAYPTIFPVVIVAMNALILDRRLDRILLRLGKLNSEFRQELKEMKDDLDMLSGRMDRMERRREFMAKMRDDNRCEGKGDDDGRDVGACVLDELKGLDRSSRKELGTNMLLSTRESGTHIPFTTTWPRMNDKFLACCHTGAVERRVTC